MQEVRIYLNEDKTKTIVEVRYGNERLKSELDGHLLYLDSLFQVYLERDRLLKKLRGY